MKSKSKCGLAILLFTFLTPIFDLASNARAETPINLEFWIYQMDAELADLFRGKLMESSEVGAAAVSRLGALEKSGRVKLLDSVVVSTVAGQRKSGQSKREAISFPDGRKIPGGINVETDVVYSEAHHRVDTNLAFTYIEKVTKGVKEYGASTQLITKPAMTMLVAEWREGENTKVLLYRAKVDSEPSGDHPNKDVAVYLSVLHKAKGIAGQPFGLGLSAHSGQRGRVKVTVYLRKELVGYDRLVSYWEVDPVFDVEGAVDLRAKSRWIVPTSGDSLDRLEVLLVDGKPLKDKMPKSVPGKIVSQKLKDDELLQSIDDDAKGLDCVITSWKIPH